MPPPPPSGHCEPQQDTIRNNIDGAAHNWINTVHHAAYQIATTNFKIIFPPVKMPQLQDSFQQEINQLIEIEKFKAQKLIGEARQKFYDIYPLPCPRPKGHEDVLINRFNQDYAAALIGISKLAQIAITVMMEYHRQTPHQDVFMPAFDPATIDEIWAHEKSTLSWRHTFTLREAAYKQLSDAICHKMTDYPIYKDQQALGQKLQAAKGMVAARIEQLSANHMNRNEIMRVLYAHLEEDSKELQWKITNLAVCTGQETYVTRDSTTKMYEYFKDYYRRLRGPIDLMVHRMLVKLRAVRFYSDFKYRYTEKSMSGHFGRDRGLPK